MTKMVLIIATYIVSLLYITWSMYLGYVIFYKKKIECCFTGAAIQTTMDNTNTVMYAECIRNMCTMGLSLIRDVDPTNELTFLRVGTKKLEMMAHVGRFLKITPVKH